MFKLIKGHLKQYTPYAVLSPVCVILEVILEVFIPFLMTKIVDIGVANSDMGYIARIGGLMVVFALASLCFGALAGRFSAKAATGLARNVRKSLFYKVSEFSFYNVDRFSSASLLTRMTTDVNNTQISFMMMTRVMFRAPVMIICATIMASRINSELSLVFLIILPVVAVAMAALIWISFPRFQKMLKKYDGLNASVQENLIAMRVVKAFVREDYEKGNFRDSADLLMKAQLKAEKVIIIHMPLMSFAIYTCMIAISWFGGNLIIAGNMEAGQLMGFIGYVMNVMISLMMISMIFITLVLAKASIARINEVMEEKIDITDDGCAEDLTVADGSVEFRDVSFSYSRDKEKLTLEHVNFRIEPGEIVGILGGTGSSKTTLVQLIPRLYDVMEGSILVGGRDVREYKLNNLRDSVAMVLQKNVLFSGTIRDNLKWGDENATEDELVAAAKAAQAHDFIMSFPDQYDTELGQGGVNVSGGQKQRLCIARALVKKPKIIILDDSTSAVDMATDAKIRKAFREQLRETTAIIIAQRIDSVKDADKIIVLEEGRINGMGTHETLLRENEIYREVYESQKKGAEL